VGRRDPAHAPGPSRGPPLTAFVETDVLVRHLTGDLPAMAGRATAYLAADTELLAERCVAEAIRSLLAFDAIVTVDPALVLPAVEVYETARSDFAEAYLVACAESTGVGEIASFDRTLDRVSTITRIGPPR
jgi:predicted nucleic acid-binding protein